MIDFGVDLLFDDICEFVHLGPALRSVALKYSCKFDQPFSYSVRSVFPVDPSLVRLFPEVHLDVQ